MNLTVKEERLLKNLKKTLRHRYIYICYGIGAIIGMIGLIKGIIVKNNYIFMLGNFTLIIMLLSLWFHYYRSKLHAVIEKLEVEIGKQNNQE